MEALDLISFLGIFVSDGAANFVVLHLRPLHVEAKVTMEECPWSDAFQDVVFSRHRAG